MVLALLKESYHLDFRFKMKRKNFLKLKNRKITDQAVQCSKLKLIKDLVQLKTKTFLLQALKVHL